MRIFCMDGRAKPCQYPYNTHDQEVQRTWTTESVLVFLDVLPAKEERESLAMATARAWIEALRDNKIEPLSSILPGFRLLDESELLMLKEERRTAWMAERIDGARHILVRSDHKLPIFLRAWMQLKVSGYSHITPKKAFWEFSVFTSEARFP